MTGWQRDLLTFTNLASLVVAVRHHPRHPDPRHPYRPLLLATLLASGCASFIFHATENGAYQILPGLVVDHNVPRSSNIDAILYNEPVRTWCEMNTKVLLKIDEMFALLMIAQVVHAVFLKGKPHLKKRARFLGAVLFPLQRFPVLATSAIVSLAVSDLLLDGTPHALLHSLWHVLAFTMVEKVLTKIDRVHPPSLLASPKRLGPNGANHAKFF